MKLTAEQEAQVAREKQADPSKTSFHITTTPEQRAYLQRAIEEEIAGKEANIARMLRLEALLAEDSSLGRLRRAIDADERSWSDLERDAGVSAKRLEQFFCGDVDLTATETDRLISALGLHLVPASSTAES